jgi:hypothetical protein
MPRKAVAWDEWFMRYAFHGHESELDLKDIVTFEPELAKKIARLQGEPDVEEAIAVVLDVFGGAYVREQRSHLEKIGASWARLAPLATGDNDRERVRAIPDRLGYRFDSVWREGRAALHLMLRSVALTHGCSMRDAPLHVDEQSVAMLMEALVDGLRAGFAASVDAAIAVELLERAVGSSKGGAKVSRALDFDWAAEITRTNPQGQAVTSP